MPQERDRVNGCAGHVSSRATARKKAPDGCPLDEWQRMVLLEARGLLLYSIVRGGIGWIRRLACLKHGPDFSDGYFSSKSSVSRTRRPPPGRIPRDGTDSQPEALKLLVVSNSWRRNVPPSSRRLT